jgi:hypothetical protein
MGRLHNISEKEVARAFKKAGWETAGDGVEERAGNTTDLP